MLREESQRRMKAARKQKWANFRLAKESATVTHAASSSREPSCSATMITF